MPTGGRTARARALRSRETIERFPHYAFGSFASYTMGGMSVVVYRTAYALRLPRERVESLLDEDPARQAFAR